MKLRFELAHVFPQAPETVWPFVTDTERINRISGYSPVRYEEYPLPQGGSERYGNGRTGPLAHRYREYDFEWEYPRWTSAEVVFTKGPIVRMSRKISLEPKRTGLAEQSGPYGTGLLWEIEVEVRNVLEALLNQLFFRIKNFPALRKLFEELARQPEPQRSFRFSPITVGRNGPDLEKIMTSYSDTERRSETKRILNEVIDLPSYEAARIRPYRLAKRIGLDKRVTLEAMLRASKSGFFDLQWNILCPSCRSPKATVGSLSQLEGAAHCAACNIDFNAEFDRSVELTFRPTSLVRPVDDTDYCIGNPQKTPHIAFQRRVAPGTTATLDLSTLGSGVWRMVSPQSRGFELPEPGYATELSLSNGMFHRIAAQAAGNTSITVTNDEPHEILIKIERADWLSDVVTAADVTTFQEFRRSFATEALRPGTELAVRMMAVLFTDLRGSTAFYNRVGDAAAFGKVRDHFDLLTGIVEANEGAVVKTIGDAIMAAFLEPQNAVKAALSIQAAIGGFNESSGGGGRDNDLIVKVGVHCGTVLAVNLNGRLDYFGRTVNLAARTEGQCNGGDVVLTRDIMMRQGVLDFLRSKEYRLTRFRRPIKGFDEDFDFYRVVSAVGSAEANPK